MEVITKQIESNISVRNMTSNSGREIPNQFIIKTNNGVMFRSYDSNIAFIPNDERFIYLGSDWDYSRTTGKYRNQFLGMNKKEIEAGIKDGSIIVMEAL